METPLRSLAKAVTWQALGLVTMTAITFALTGSLATGGAVALVSAITGAVFYILHERLWARVRWGLAEAQRLARGEESGPRPQL
jgi:uncharacterized membrane protein